MSPGVTIAFVGAISLWIIVLIAIEKHDEHWEKFTEELPEHPQAQEYTE